MIEMLRSTWKFLQKSSYDSLATNREFKFIANEHSSLTAAPRIGFSKTESRAIQNQRVLSMKCGRNA
jgi:hypothetical protein